MENDRRRIPSQSSNSGPGNSPVHGGYSTTGGAFTGTMGQNAMSAHYSNAPPSRQLPPPPGFEVQNSMSMYQFSEATQRQLAPSFHNFSPFGPSSQFVVNEKFGIPQNTGYPNFYSQENTRRSSIINQQSDFGGSTLADQQQYSTNGSLNAYRLDNGADTVPNGTSSQQHSAGGSSSSSYARQNRPSDENLNNNKVINPLIDNIVGSMAMSNGTYTHFGPAMGTHNFSSERVGPFGRSEVREEDILESIGASLSSLGSCGSGKESPVGVIGTNNTGVSVRASTPNDGMDIGSRPQTPGKPSYSEILAKNASQNGFMPSASSHRKLSSASPSPIAGKTLMGDSFQSMSHQNLRKSVDYLNMSSNSSAASSSCASASSSPVAKQKSISQSIVGRLFNPTKGKENNTDHGKAGGTSRNTTSGTPTHQSKSGQSKGDSRNNSQKSNERKVLSSSENNGTGGKSKLLQSSAKSTETSLGVASSFDFEIQDLDEESEWGWKTYTSRSRNHFNKPNNASSTGGKRYNDENFEINDGGIINEKHNATENNNDVDISDRRESLTEKRPSSSTSQPSGSSAGSTAPGSSNNGGGPQSQRKGREKDKAKTRRDDRNCAVRRVERIFFLWAAHMISAAAWLLKLVTDVVSLSISVGSTLMEDFHFWWVTKALPTCFQQLNSLKDKSERFCWKIRQTVSWRTPFRRKSEDQNSSGIGSKRNGEELLAALGPERNIALPLNGDEALKRLLSVKGQDPYSILGIRSDSSDETIRRYYKKQAVLVHPDKNLVIGAEEAFKILARAFELIGEPLKRAEYHQKLLEAHAKEKVYGEIGKLLEQLRKKMEIATSSIRCTKCNSRHKKNKTDRPLFAARYCAQCGIHHGAREGELWAERSGWFGLSWNYFACMDCHVWEINEWARCQKKNLQHIKPDSHNVMYRLVAGNGNNQQGQQQASNGNVGHSADGHFHVDPEDDWDSLINNLCKSPGGVPGGGGHFFQQGKGGSSCPAGATVPSSNSSASGKKRKGKRK